ncbi:hypothetical protein BD779DRAFT_1563340 [Infundibulicybe gibba]|nr:hypothetical protein BD779DRAFT_1563340 [Infundibulicybe gibba]
MPELIVDGFSAWVSIDGVKLPPYGVETTTVKGVKMVTGWIASKVDKAFEVGYSIPAYPEALGGDFYVDGIGFGGRVHKLGKPDSLTRSSKRVSNTMARPLIFSRTEFTGECYSTRLYNSCLAIPTYQMRMPI